MTRVARSLWIVLFATLLSGSAVAGKRPDGVRGPTDSVEAPGRRKKAVSSEKLSARDQAYLSIMLEGSMRVSRTVDGGRQVFQGQGRQGVQDQAKKNFHDTAIWLVKNRRNLPVTLATAMEINKRLTKGLVPAKYRGDFLYYGRNPIGFLSWLLSDEAKRLGKKDPVALAEKVHFSMSRLDAFPDGNGRTARMLADLVLMKHGRPPVLYTSLGDYLRRGAIAAPGTSIRQPVPLARRKGQKAYFREIAKSGETAYSIRILPRRFPRSHGPR